MVDLFGFSDSKATANGALPKCPRCQSISRVEGDLCVGCLLQNGLGSTDECAKETLESILTEITVPDENRHFGNYQIFEEIGRGGMGVIYRARQRYSGRIVAVKRIQGPQANSRETLARFRREAQAAASLDHPNILPIYEVGESEDGIPFFSMKFAAGGSFASAAESLKNDPRRSVKLMAMVTRAVEYAHGKGILHRDLKPGNILLDEQGNPLVSDFGLAKWLNTPSDLTNTSTIFGTPGYIAPEQARNSTAAASPAADIYSLGAILFDLLTGRPPFLGSHAVSVIRQAAENQAPKLRSLCELTDRDLETICARCLEREPSARYDSARHLAEDLERWLEGRPILARPVSPPVRMWRWVKRNRGLAGAIAGCLSLGLLALSSNLQSGVHGKGSLLQSVAVLPFEDLDEFSTTSTSARSATSALNAALAETKTLLLRSDASIMDTVDPGLVEQWRQIGGRVNARVMLTGSIRQREGKNRVSLHVIETASGSILKTWLIDGDSNTDITQPLAKNVSDYLSGPINTHSKAPGDTSNSAARSYYDQGKEFFFRYNLPDQERAIQSFRKAVEIDPNYAQAYAMLATACQLRSSTDPDKEWITEGEKAVESALRIAPMLPEAHCARAAGLRCRGQYLSAIDPFLIAYELDPSGSRVAAKLGSIYEVLGRPDLAMLWFEKAARRETRPIYDDNIASVWAALGEYDKAEQAYRTAAVFRPDLPVSAIGLSVISLYRGAFEDARQQCAAARLKYTNHSQPLIVSALIEFFSGHNPQAEKLYREALDIDRTGGVECTGSVRFLSALGFILSKSGMVSEGRQLLQEAQSLDEQELSRAPENPDRLYSLAANHAALGNIENALGALAKASGAGWIDFRLMELDPRFESIRNSAPFNAALTHLKQKVQMMAQRVGKVTPKALTVRQSDRVSER